MARRMPSEHQTEIRDWSKEKDATIRKRGYNHPTGPTTMIYNRDMPNVRADYRRLREGGMSPQDARSNSIRNSYKRKMAEIGSRGWGPH